MTVLDVDSGTGFGEGVIAKSFCKWQLVITFCNISWSASIPKRFANDLTSFSLESGIGVGFSFIG